MWSCDRQRPADHDEPRWTHISQFLPRSTSKFSFLEYWEAECEFVRVAVRALEWVSAESVSVWQPGDPPRTIPVAPNESLVDQVPIQHLDPVIRYNLRDHIWTRLFFRDQLYITFGYDMNMYIGFSSSSPDYTAEKLQRIFCRDVTDRKVDTDFHFFGMVRPVQGGF
jgi:hypothetical protein